jgi:mannose/fructose-specific phosphotransferase system component IIA
MHTKTPISKNDFKELVTKFIEDTTNDEEVLLLLDTMNGVLSELAEVVSLMPTDDDLRAKGIIK